MKGDAKSNFTLDDDGLPALSRGADTYTTETLDHTNAPAVSYFISCGTWAGSFVATLQHSDDNSAWTPEEDVTAGNTINLTLTEAGNGQIDVPNPRARYSNLSIVIGGTCVFSVTSVLGPLRHVAPQAEGNN